MREQNRNRARRLGVSGWLKREWLDAEKEIKLRESAQKPEVKTAYMQSLV